METRNIKDLLKIHRAVITLIGIVLMLSLIPILDTYLVIGKAWQGIPPTFSDEAFYSARVQAIVKGYETDGNPYFFEHANGPPLVIFGGAWLNAIPQLVGLSFNAALLFNFIVWSLLFVGVLYWLFRELKVSPWIAVFSSILLYMQSYAHIWRPVNLQTVYPFYFLFYIALVRFIREQNRKNIIFLALATGATFYLFAFMWQIAVITLGILFLYAFLKKNWQLLKATLISSIIGSIIGLPIPLYILWLSHASPYFWESIGRLGLVHTHIPMAEVIYSGGWIGVVFIFLNILYMRTRIFQENKKLAQILLFLSVSGLGLWIMQGSNLITGKLLETGEHLRILIFPWLVCSTVCVGMFLWRGRMQLSKKLQIFSIITLALLSGVNIYFTYQAFYLFLPSHVSREAWQLMQLYAKPFAWIEHQEKDPVVIWSDPNDYVTTNIPIFTKHFTLYDFWGILELVPESEIHERYLVSEYFNNPTVQDLKQRLAEYVGRQDAFHNAKTIEREIKVCKILFFWNKNKDCGIPLTSQELLGDTFFQDLEKKFQGDIKPNIRVYLKKYHVSYILKDTILNPEYRPEILGGVRVYKDDRYEIYKLPII